MYTCYECYDTINYLRMINVLDIKNKKTKERKKLRKRNLNKKMFYIWKEAKSEHNWTKTYFKGRCDMRDDIS